MTISIEDLIKNPNDIPMLPANVAQILKAINDPDTSAEYVADLISRDVGLTTKVLKLANSSYFGLSSKVATISHSLNIIGLKPIGSIVLASALMSQFKGIPEKYVTMESFWSHSIAAGIAAKEICKLKKLRNNEELLYIAGMVHDIGSLVIYKEYPEKAKKALVQCNEEGRNLVEAEREILGFDHAQLGAALIERWNLSEVIKETTEYHHHPLNAPIYKQESSIIYLADYIIHSNQLGSSGELQCSELDQEVLNNLELSMDSLALISEKTIESFDEIYNVLNQ